MAMTLFHTSAARARLAGALLLLFAAGAGAQTRDPLPFPDLPGYRTLKADFHVHTVFSDGEVWPTTRIDEAWREGLDVIALTDHAGYNPHRDDVSVDLRRPDAIARPAADRYGILLIPGVEIAEGNLHANALFVTDPNAFDGLPLVEALRIARAQGAFVFWNHPGWKQKPEWFRPIAEAYDEHLLQGVELVNGLDFYPEVFPWVEEKKLTIVSDSDVHVPTSAEYRPRTRPFTLVFARTADPAGVREALLARRTAACMGGQLWGAEEYLEPLWRASVAVGNSSLRFAPGVRAATLRLRNGAAVPFRLRAIEPPDWLFVGSGEAPAEGEAAMGLALAENAPPGVHSIELQYEITNLHVSPGRNLRVRIPVRIEVAAQ